MKRLNRNIKLLSSLFVLVNIFIMPSSMTTTNETSNDAITEISEDLSSDFGTPYLFPNFEFEACGPETVTCGQWYISSRIYCGCPKQTPTSPNYNKEISKRTCWTNSWPVAYWTEVKVRCPTYCQH